MSPDELREVLREGTRGVAASPGLWDRTQRRVRVRQLRRLAASAAAVLLLLAAVPPTIALLTSSGERVEFTDRAGGGEARGGDPGDVEPGAGLTPAPQRGVERTDVTVDPPAGTRTVTHLGLALDVPEDWDVVDADALSSGTRSLTCPAPARRVVLGGVVAFGCDPAEGHAPGEVVMAPLWDRAPLVAELSARMRADEVELRQRNGLTVLDTSISAGVLSQRPSPAGEVAVTVVPGLQVALEGPPALLDRLLPTLRPDGGALPDDVLAPLAGHYGSVLVTAGGALVEGWVDAVAVPEAPPARTVVSPASTPAHTVVATLERAPGGSGGGRLDVVVRSGPAAQDGADEAWRLGFPGAGAEDAPSAPAPVWSPDGRSLAWLTGDPAGEAEITVATWGGTGPVTGDPDRLEATPVGHLPLDLPDEASAGGADPALFRPALVRWAAGEGVATLEIGFVARHGTPVGPAQVGLRTRLLRDGAWAVHVAE